MLSPGRSAVCGQAARGTIAPLRATAIPRWLVSTAFSSNKAGRIDGSATPSRTSRGDGVGGDRRKQNSVAVVTGGIDEPIQWPGAENRRVVPAARSMADPHFLDSFGIERFASPARAAAE
jgi:hypothetical protein